ncbi:TPA: acid-shock protein, partial [Serratia marcescens]|nr:acid-shock protein [Serratia marcescens]HAU5740820.1 acid-shock protein [Serratia marcescens]HAU5746490.1 acid-shock protein [Serratia marcescens]HAU5756982.1 acid-shock protein [Serratia marcescens]HAU5766290.1 acid-shock protein [Serratia marcescens]
AKKHHKKAGKKAPAQKAQAAKKHHKKASHKKA